MQLKNALTCFMFVSLALLLQSIQPLVAADRPNILFAIADDWGWPHAGAYDDAVVQTPTFDRLAREGALFEQAYVSSPSCTPSRGAILTGKYHWQLEGAANLWSTFPDKFKTYPEQLKAAGYQTGATGKTWGPGKTETPARPLAGGRSNRTFADFLERRPKRDQPFCFWLGSIDPHRPYDKGTGAARGMDLSKVHLFGHYPDVPEIRSDVADYYFEVERFDRLVGDAIAALEQAGELNNTIIVMTGDHGMPFPRCKSNNYDCGTRVPLAIRWPAQIKAGTVVREFVSLIDLAPTFYEAAGVEMPESVAGRSLLPLLAGKSDGHDRGFVLHGKERHVPGQEGTDLGGYPSRAIRTNDFLYIHNLKPERWPAGTPDYKKAAMENAWLADCDNGPTKTYIVENRDRDEIHRRAYNLCFGKRPADELYDLAQDPEQLQNVAAEPAYAQLLAELKAKLWAELAKTGDPRVTGSGPDFDSFPYIGGAPAYPGTEKTKKQRNKTR